jgi:hypothetical protein
MKQMLELKHARIQNLGGGGDYVIETYQSLTINHKIWLCEVTRHVFNGLPGFVYFKKVSNLA